MGALTITVNASTQLTMTSLEIAELTGKELKQVHRDIRVMLVGLYGEEHVARIVPEQYRNRHSEFIRENADSILSAIAGHHGAKRHHDGFKGDHQDKRGFSWVRDKRGYITLFRLDYSHTLTLISGYNLKIRKVIIDRWQELEDQAANHPKFTIPETLPDALRLAASLAEENEVIKRERDEAIATKAYIGSRREAQAMAAASVAKREADKLQDELDRSKRYATVKRVERMFPDIKFNWRVLKKLSYELDRLPIEVFDKNYGSVKSYHAEVWMKAYEIDLNNLVKAVV